MRLTRDLSILFVLLVAAAMVNFATPDHRVAGIALLWLALLVLVFLLLALVLEVKRLQKRIEGLKTIPKNNEREGRGF